MSQRNSGHLTGHTHSDMLTQAALTPFAKQSLNEMQPKYLIEVFQEQELQVNITKHVLVPKHQARPSSGSMHLLQPSATLPFCSEVHLLIVPLVYTRYA